MKKLFVAVSLFFIALAGLAGADELTSTITKQFEISADGTADPFPAGGGALTFATYAVCITNLHTTEYVVVKACQDGEASCTADFADAAFTSGAGSPQWKIPPGHSPCFPFVARKFSVDTDGTNFTILLTVFMNGETP